MMDDTISRQAAIDAIRASTSKYTGFMEMEMYTDDDAVEAIEGLPSVQTEITRCHECAKRRTLDCPMGITVFDAPPSDGYCYKAERRNDG